MAVRILLLLALVPATTAAQETEWLVAPYGWLPDIMLGQSSDGSGGGISASDLLEKTDATGMIRIEAARNQWGVSLDYIFLGLSDEQTVPLTLPISPAASVRGELDLDVLELSGIYRPSGDAEGNTNILGEIAGTLVAFEMGFELLPGTGRPAPESDLNPYEVQDSSSYIRGE